MTSLLNCKEVTRRLALGDWECYSPRERFVMRFHLAICWVCRRYERQVKAIGRAFARSIQERLEREDLPRWRARLIRHLGKS